VCCIYYHSWLYISRLYPHTFLEFDDFALFPNLFQSVDVKNFQVTSFRPKFLSQPEFEMVSSLANIVYPDELCFHSLSAVNQFRPSKLQNWRVDFYVPRFGVVYELLGT
jgi:hypothetical protein